MPTNSMSGVLLNGSQLPRIRVAPPAAYSEGEFVTELCGGYGLRLDPWQQSVLEAGFARRDDGRFAARTVGVCAPRQSGKGVLIEAAVLAGVLLFKHTTQAVSAHETRTTRVSFDRVMAYFDNYDDLRKRVASVQRWTGREQIRFRSGQVVVFPARSRGSLRGYSCDALILDESQYLSDSEYEAILPTLSARPDTQTWMLGTVPTHQHLDGEVFTRVRAAAVAGKDDRLAYLEWSADPDDPVDDPETWAKANPALGSRISVEAVQAEFRELSLDGFKRERLGIWPVAGAAAEQVFDPEVWAGLAAPGPSGPPAALAVDRTKDGLLMVAGCWKSGATSHVEVVLTREGDDVAGVVEWLRVNAKRTIPVAVDGGGTAAALMPALAGFKCKVVPLATGDVCRAAAGFVDAVNGGQLAHGDQPELNAAVLGAVRRPVGRAGGFAWDRAGAVAAAPLVAASLAVQTAATVRPRTGRANFFDC